MTLGSLFDGSGGFPLAALISGIVPLWASEIEPFPIRVTTKRLPFVQHLGDISTINGAEIKPVDIITFGSPCTDMSIAGKRRGLGGQQSYLFYHAIRVIKEMRCVTDGEYPRFIVWENVTGAFSSNKGEDFKAVLEAVCSIKDSKVDITRPTKWTKAGEILADDYSIAWRVLDAQYWGVPQRRKRIYLVADFAGESAGKILFESEGLSGYSSESFKAWQGTTDRIGEGFEATSNNLMFENHRHDARYTESLDTAPTISTTYGIGSYKSKAMLSDNPYAGIYEAKISRTLDTQCANPACNQGGIAVVAGVAYGIDRATYNMGQNAQFGITIEEEIEPTMVASGPGAVAHPVYTTSKNPYYIVRRLTPIECARLQGFRATWCSNLETENPTEEELAFWREVFETHRKVVTNASKPKTDKQILKWLRNPHSDSAEYKMWGNGIALPCAVFVLSGIIHYAHKSDT